MKRLYPLITGFLFFFLVYLFPDNLFAAYYSFLFWYPGESGTPEAAQPLMDLFANYLKANIPGSTWNVRYISSELEGNLYLKKEKADFGVISFVAFQKNRTMGEKIGSTLPLPHGSPKETIMVVSGPCEESIQPTILFTTEPITSMTQFKTIFSEWELHKLPDEWKINSTVSMLRELKAIGQGSCHKALLNEHMWITLKKLNTPWSEKIAVIKKASIDSAPLIAFRKTNVQSALLDVLKRMSKDPQGQTLLTELRLKGFE